MVGETINGQKAEIASIYNLSDDTLRICMPEGKPLQRPTGFESKPDDVGNILMVFNRKK
jgi:uncharacterized protein (TIGR03067 family)